MISCFLCYNALSVSLAHQGRGQGSDRLLWSGGFQWVLLKVCTQILAGSYFTGSPEFWKRMSSQWDISILDDISLASLFTLMINIYNENSRLYYVCYFKICTIWKYKHSGNLLHYKKPIYVKLFWKSINTRLNWKKMVKDYTPTLS